MQKPTIVSCLIFLGFIPAPAHAGFLSDAWGILTDPIKINAATENIMHSAERSMIHLERIQQQFGQDVEKSLAKVDRIVGDTRKDLLKLVSLTGTEARSVTDNAFMRVSELQRDVFRDANQFVKCTTVVTLEKVQSSLAESMNQLGERKPRLEIFGWTVISAKIDPVDIKDPIQTFRTIKSIYQKRIDAVSENDHPSKITDIYGEMQRLSDLARCHYKNDTGLFEELYWTEIDYNRQERAWRGQVI